MKIYFIKYEIILIEWKYIFLSYQFLFLQHFSNNRCLCAESMSDETSFSTYVWILDLDIRIEFWILTLFLSQTVLFVSAYINYK